MTTLAIHPKADTAELQSLEDVSRARRQRVKANRKAMADAKKPRAPLAIQVQATMKRKGFVPVETLERFDVILSSIDRLAVDNPLDAGRIAKALLASLLRLAWMRESGKQFTNPEPETIPHRLFQRQAMDKATMRRIDHAIKKDDDASNLLECCRAMIVWLAA